MHEMRTFISMENVLSISVKFSFQYIRKAVAKNVPTTAQFHSSHTLTK